MFHYGCTQRVLRAVVLAEPRIFTGGPSNGQILAKRRQGCRARHAQAQTRNAEARQEGTRWQGQESQAGDRHRPLRGAEKGQEGSAQIEEQIRPKAQDETEEQVLKRRAWRVAGGSKPAGDSRLYATQTPVATRPGSPRCVLLAAVRTPAQVPPRPAIFRSAFS